MANIAYTLDELLATRFSSSYITKFDPAGLVAALNEDLANHNAIMNDMLSLYCTQTIEQLRAMPSSEAGTDFAPLDEVGKGPSGNMLPGQTLGFPLRRFGRTTNVTRFWAETATPYDLLMRQADIENAHRARVYHELRRGLYHKANYTFVDKFWNGISLPVKCWHNADSWLIPNGPTGTTFDGTTHDHYHATAALAVADVDGIVTDVSEHGYGGLEIHIPLASKTAFTALASFQPLTLPGYAQEPSTGYVTEQKLNVRANPGNQQIGWWNNNSIPVFVKPFALDNYIAVVSTDAKPLAYRIHPNQALNGLHLYAKNTDGSFIEDAYEWLGGFAPMTRGGCAILYTAGAAWVDPTFSA